MFTFHFVDGCPATIFGLRLDSTLFNSSFGNLFFSRSSLILPDVSIIMSKSLQILYGMEKSFL